MSHEYIYALNSRVDQLEATIKVLEVQFEDLDEIVRQNSSNIVSLSVDAQERLGQLLVRISDLEAPDERIRSLEAQLNNVSAALHCAVHTSSELDTEYRAMARKLSEQQTKFHKRLDKMEVFWARINKAWKGMTS